MRCRSCNNSKIKVRTNHAFGTKSRARKTPVCKTCGSTNIEVEEPGRKRFQRRR